MQLNGVTSTLIVAKRLDLYAPDQMNIVRSTTFNASDVLLETSMA
jgi:hypothetical protein